MNAKGFYLHHYSIALRTPFHPETVDQTQLHTENFLHKMMPNNVSTDDGHIYKTMCQILYNYDLAAWNNGTCFNSNWDRSTGDTMCTS